AEQHRALRYPHDRVIGGVGGGTYVAYLGSQVASMHRDLIGERNKWGIERQVAPVGSVPERHVGRRPEGDRLESGALEPDDRRAREHAVAERMVAVVMGVHNGAYRGVGDRGDRV